MNFLSISSSQRSASLSYFRNSQEVVTVEAELGAVPSAWFPAGVMQVEKNAGIILDTLDYIAVDIGPGSFTGIKVAISFVKGLAFRNRMPIIPVNAMEGMAVLVPCDGMTAIIQDARRGLYYLGIFCKKGDALQCAVEPCVVSENELKNKISAISCEGITIIADERLLLTLGRKGLSIPSLPACSKGIGIRSLYHHEVGNISDGGSVKPLYIRPPDAEISRKAR